MACVARTPILLAHKIEIKNVLPSYYFIPYIPVLMGCANIQFQVLKLLIRKLKRVFAS